jgi:uncharacterized membrane protein
MNEHYVSAVFDTQSEAENAVAELRSAGVADSAISLIAQHDGRNVTTDGSGDEAAQDVIGKTALGAGIGTVLGIAALAIPGVGPLVAAGAIAAAAVPGAALTGAAIGAAAGGLAGFLTDHGVSRDDASYYEDRIGSGGVFVSADTTGSQMHASALQDLLYRAGGHSSTRAKMSAVM